MAKLYSYSLRNCGWVLSTLSGALPSQMQRIMWHKYYRTTEHYVGAQQMMEGAGVKITQIQKHQRRLQCSRKAIQQMKNKRNLSRLE